MPELSTEYDLTAVQRAFGKQAPHYDPADSANPILASWRQRVYAHLDCFLKPKSRILELNAGTGIDALRLASQGHTVDATDVSPGMVHEIQKKVNHPSAEGRLAASQCSYEELDKLSANRFDHIFSNFGGLNCCEDLARVTRHLPNLLNPHGRLTWVIMPPCCPWEWLGVFKGRRAAFRRLKKGGTLAHLEGEFFPTYYHSLSTLRAKLGPTFRLLRAEGLGALSPPPASLSFVNRHMLLYAVLKQLDQRVRLLFPFTRWADHLIVTFEYTG